MSSASTEAPPLSQEAISELCRCKDAKALADSLTQRRELLSPAVVEQLTDVVRQKVRVNVEEALRLAEVALAIARALSNAESMGRGFRAKANALWFKGDCLRAVELFKMAITHFERANRIDEVARTLSSSIQSLTLLGEYEQASRAAERAREIFRRLGDYGRLARVELNAANIHHRQDRFEEALSCYESAYQQLLPHKDMEGLGAALHNMAVCLIMLNDFNRAVGCYARARALCEQHSMPLLVAQADYNIAYLHFLRGDYQRAIEGLRNTRQRSQANGDTYHAALCDLDESEIYLELNLTDEAARMSRGAERQFERLKMPHELGRARANMAIAAHRQSDTAGSLELFAKAKIIFAKEDNRAWQALIDLYQALVLLDIGKFEAARDLCVHALTFFEASGLDRRAVLCYLLLTHLWLEVGNLQEAQQNCSIALRKTALIEAPLLKYEANVLQGHIQQRAEDWSGAYDAYTTARLELETLRGHLQREELKIAFVKNKGEVYENLVGLLLRKRSSSADEEAFSYIEQAKSRTLVELLSRTGAEGSYLEDERIQGLRKELNWYYHRIEIEQTRAGGISLELIKKLRAEACSLENEFIHLLRTFGPENRASTILGITEAMSLAQIQAELPADATLLEYFQIGSRFVAAVVTREELSVVNLAPCSKVIHSVRMLDFQLSKFQLTNSYTREFENDLFAATENRLRELYEDLVAPLASCLKGRHLIVAPHGILHYLPFHAFSNSGEYLIDRFTISFAPSASIYTLCRHKAPAGGHSLVLGVRDRNAPWIEREVRAVAAVLPDSRVFLGRRATVDVLRTTGATSRMIHIATHGVFRRDNPGFSSIRLADSYLTLYDVYRLKLPVELLTLSGCGTGLNMIAAGDELVGLTRGFLRAGAKALLLTLWVVHDRTTAEFMVSFYNYLRRQDKSAALSAAMLELRSRYPHPYYWAPFILVGNTIN